MPLSAIPAAPGARHIVFFDGVCNMCNRSVRLLLRLDRRRVLSFATLQSETADRLRNQRLLDPISTADDPLSEKTFRSVVLVANEGSSDPRVYRNSAAVLQILRHIGGPCKVVSWLRILPSALLDPCYAIIASHRYRWFGKKDVCWVPTADLGDRFLDRG